MKTFLCLSSILALFFASCAPHPTAVSLSHGVDISSGNQDCYIISTATATYYLEKQGGGLSSMLDIDGVDWLGFHKEPGSAHKGEYRGFPNAIHNQDGNYFHALNAGTELSTSVVEIEEDYHIRIIFTSENKKWEGRWDFYSDRCDFTMAKVSPGYHYWILYEGVPGGEMDDTDFWFSSAEVDARLINENRTGDLPAPEWIAFGDVRSPRMIYLLNHQDDTAPDGYIHRADMTVFGFGRLEKEKYLDTPQTFSIGFVEANTHPEVENKVGKLLSML